MQLYKKIKFGKKKTRKHIQPIAEAFLVRWLLSENI